MDVGVLFACVPVSDFKAAQAWYERFFGRAADVVAHENEVMWRVTDGGWLYIVRDTDRAGNTIVAMAVSNIKEATAALRLRDVATGPILREGPAGWQTRVQDPDGNSIEIIEVVGDR
jgi:catechol 2,3-dioxygenase-like lactoylglutathione lyase family enzyme